MKKIFTLFLSLTFLSLLPAQTLKHCGTDEAIRNLLKSNPGLQQFLDKRQSEIQRQDMEMTSGTANNRSSSYVYIIPIVFHIIHNYGSEDISDAQVIDAVRILNRDYRKLNADTSNIVPEFKALASDIEVEFRLANIDPNGNCTNGIDRIVSSQTYIGDDGSKLNAWPSNQYLNVWTVQSISSGAAGYAYYPGSAPNGADGVLILADYVGSIGTGNNFTARALTHEVGHWLNLAHVWGDTNSPGVACGNDGIGDTPITKGWTNCNLSSNDVCNPGVVENVQNYMEYSYCSKMFTTGQRNAMRNALNSPVGGRNNVWTTSNQSDTGIDIVPPSVCIPNVDFKGDNLMACEGASVNFTDLSWNGRPTSWDWSFPGGTPATSTDSMPVVIYNTAGKYSVTLTATNASGSAALTKSNYVSISSTTAAYSNVTYFEGFETSNIPNSDWTIKSGDNVTWTRTNAAKYSYTYSMRIANYGAAAGDVDEAISNSYDISALGTKTLTFQLAFTRKLATNNDKLRVLISKNCGRTWTQIYSKSGASLQTAASTQATNFTPTFTQWRRESIDISSYAADTNVRVKFEFTGDSGNNIYIDNINMGGALAGLNQADYFQLINLSVYPNPLHNSVISFTLPQREYVKISLCDLLGRTVSVINDKELSSGNQEITLDNAHLNPGIYFVTLNLNNRSIVKKVFVAN